MDNNSVKSTKPKKQYTPEQFLFEANQLIGGFNWHSRSVTRNSEVALIASLGGDSPFSQYILVYDISRNMLKCMLVYQKDVEEKRENNIIELCSRINEGLPFGCAEYIFKNRLVSFRDSIDLDWVPLDKAIETVSFRVLNLGKKYAPSIQLTLMGKRPEDAINAIAED